jgi:hypothetical protein
MGLNKEGTVRPYFRRGGTTLHNSCLDGFIYYEYAFDERIASKDVWPTHHLTSLAWKQNGAISQSLHYCNKRANSKDDLPSGSPGMHRLI